MMVFEIVRGLVSFRWCFCFHNFVHSCFVVIILPPVPGLH